MKSKKIFIVISGLILFGNLAISCKKLLAPEDDDHSGVDRLVSDPGFGEGLLLNGYTALLNDYIFDETATDDAVTSNKSSELLRMATGEWSSQFNPLSIWDIAYSRIRYLNSFLTIVDKIRYSWDRTKGISPEARNVMFAKRFTGEALTLRAWYNFELLKRHGGIASDGVPRGFVILKTNLPVGADINLPRGTYDECVKFIIEDLDAAISLLPDVYADHLDDPDYNLVFGTQNKNRVDGLIAKALKSRVLLYVASQSFNTDADKWERSAVASSELLNANGGVSGISPTGSSWWLNLDDKEIIWRRDFTTANTIEAMNFPPSRFGRGETNPSQNLVDAFPMRNGYPISNLLSGYDENNPYNDRDPRLKTYIVYNGNDLNGQLVYTEKEDLKDGLNQTVNSTRTGYYLKKLLDPRTNLNPTINSMFQHFYTIFRYTEIYLNYAEAANEAWGPDGDPMGYGYSSRDIIASIRKRGGINQPDDYLASISSENEMRQLIHNERRIELCFEGFRFWDMRRWNLPLTEPVKGVSIENDQFTQINVEDRLYEGFMKYGPIPYQEVLKSNNTLQNEGW